MWKTSLIVAALVVLAAWGGGRSALVGQEQEKEFVFKGRLPAYYADIVTDHQKALIYTIQAKYQAKIAAINEELEAVTKQQNKEIEGVLTPEQKIAWQDMLGKPFEGRLPVRGFGGGFGGAGGGFFPPN